MDHFLGSLTGLIAVVLIFGGSLLRSALSTWERRMELQMQSQQGQSDAVKQEMAALRAELAAMRDTSTQFDMSLENSIERLEQRISHMETKTRTVPPSQETPSVIHNGVSR
jgi:hydrogenase maturation factor HypF (carbamoyltransferase family)